MHLNEPKRWAVYIPIQVPEPTRRHFERLNNDDTVLPYFSESPFFDPQSNNNTITTQALYNPSLYYLIQTREAFEGRLRTMQGLEFMVTEDPTKNDTKHEHSGVWVIRKQDRRKEGVTPISSYFVVGENVYMAPTIASILGSRLVCQVTITALA